MPVFQIMLQLTLIIRPLLLQGVKIGIIKPPTFPHPHRLVIIHLALAMKLIPHPFPIIRQQAMTIKQLPLPIHLIIQPLALIPTAIIIKQLTIAIAHVVPHVAVVAATADIVLVYVLWLVMRMLCERRLLMLLKVGVYVLLALELTCLVGLDLSQCFL